MSSATDSSSRQEGEPLLGRPGDVSQPPDRPMVYNLLIGTGAIAQAGIWILAGIVWGSTLSTELQLFSAHPLLNSAGILFAVEAILILQPTHTQAQKITGTYNHLIINDIGILLLLAGLIVIEYNKFDHGGEHFQSTHSILGLITYILIAVQATVGFTAFITPKLYGGVTRAKSLYKYHRISGYVILVLLFATVCAATDTDFNINTLHISLWSVIVASIITLVGVLPRIKKYKLGL